MSVQCIKLQLLIFIIMHYVRNIDMVHIRGRLNVDMKIKSKIDASPRGMNMGRTESVVKISGGVMPGGNDPDGKEAVNFINPGSPKGPYPSDPAAAKKMYDGELKLMYKHMVTHALQKETEEWDEGKAIAAKGGMAPDGKITAPPPFKPKGMSEDKKPPPPPPQSPPPKDQDAQSSTPSKKPPPPPPPKGPNPFKKNTPKEVDLDEPKKKKKKKKKMPEPPGAPKKKDKEDEENEEEEQKETVNEASEIAEEDIEKEKKEEFIKKVEEEKKKDKIVAKPNGSEHNEDEENVGDEEPKDSEEEQEIEDGGVKSSEKKKEEIEDRGGKSSEKKKEEIEDGGVKSSEKKKEAEDEKGKSSKKKNKSKEDKKKNVNKKLAKEENVDKTKHSKLTSSEKSPSTNNEEKGNKPQFEKRKKAKVKMNEDTDEAVMNNAMRAVDDAVGSAKVASLFSKNGADTSKPDGMFEPTGSDKPVYWDLSKYDDYDLINIKPKKKIRILYQNKSNHEHPCVIQAASCSIPLASQLDEEAVACTGIHKNGKVAEEWEPRCMINYRNFDNDKTEH
jgi:hypothetical protein